MASWCACHCAAEAAALAANMRCWHHQKFRATPHLHSERLRAGGARQPWQVRLQWLQGVLIIASCGEAVGHRDCQSRKRERVGPNGRRRDPGIHPSRQPSTKQCAQAPSAAGRRPPSPANRGGRRMARRGRLAFRSILSAAAAAAMPLLSFFLANLSRTTFLQIWEHYEHKPLASI